jgi:hypothetical protein
MALKTALCKVGTISNSLPKKHKEALETSMNKYLIVSSYDIMRAMVDAGFEVGERTIDRHRTHKCVCYKNER